MTIADLLHTQPTVSQYDILARADRAWFPTGRYYGGQLLTSDVQYLTDGIELRKSTRAQIDALPTMEWVGLLQSVHDAGCEVVFEIAPIPFESLSISGQDAEWLSQQKVADIVVGHTCICCGQPCNCGQVDPSTGNGCRECAECNIAMATERDTKELEQLPAGPECFGGEDFPSEPSAETMAAVDAVLERHKCVGCGDPCDCTGTDAATCRECEICSIPF